jgi:hypothetical protein
MMVALMGIGAAVLVTAGVMMQAPPEPKPQRSSEVRVDLSCPTEDSCAVDYRDGAYYVRQVVP